MTQGYGLQIAGTLPATIIAVPRYAIVAPLLHGFLNASAPTLAPQRYMPTPPQREKKMICPFNPGEAVPPVTLPAGHDLRLVDPGWRLCSGLDAGARADPLTLRGHRGARVDHVHHTGQRAWWRISGSADTRRRTSRPGLAALLLIPADHRQRKPAAAYRRKPFPSKPISISFTARVMSAPSGLK
jgi:hypothetical protein